VERRALITEKEDGWLCGTGCLRVSFGHFDFVDTLYASYYLGDSAVREWIVRHAIGATMPNLNTSILSALPFVVPPIPEQRAIAGMLGALDDKIELNRRMNATLESMARAVFRQWFIDGDDVESWDVGKLGDVAENIRRVFVCIVTALAGVPPSKVR
jgi:type I restriction enzyme, S subunit